MSAVGSGLRVCVLRLLYVSSVGSHSPFADRLGEDHVCPLSTMENFVVRACVRIYPCAHLCSGSPPAPNKSLHWATTGPGCLPGRVGTGPV